MRQSRSMFFQSLYRYIVFIVDHAEAATDFMGSVSIKELEVWAAGAAEAEGWPEGRLSAG